MDSIGQQTQPSIAKRKIYAKLEENQSKATATRGWIHKTVSNKLKKFS